MQSPCIILPLHEIQKMCQSLLCNVILKKDDTKTTLPFFSEPGSNYLCDKDSNPETIALSIVTLAELFFKELSL